MKNLTKLIIGLLVLIIIVQRLGCTNSAPGNPPKTDTVRVIDTLWEKHDTVVFKRIKEIKIIHDTLPPEYYPDPIYDSLKVQYEELAQDFLAKRIYSDTLRIPQLKGQFIVNDTVSYNKITGHSWSADYIIPVVTNTITITKPAPQTREVYYGGGVGVTKTYKGSAQIGILYKDRKDRITGVYAGFNPSGQIIYGFQSYWKININK